MTEKKTVSVDKAKVIQQIADLSKMLGMIPDDDTVVVRRPMTDISMELSQWFKEARNSFLKLSLLIDDALDLKLQ